MDMTAILYNDVEPFDHINDVSSIWWKLVKLFQRRTLFMITRFIHVSNHGVSTDSPREQSLLVTKRVCYFDHTLNVSAVSFWYSLRKWFSIFSNTNAWRRSFDLAVKGQRSTYDHLWYIGRPWVPDIIYQYPALKLSWFWRRRFLSVLSYMGMAAILVNGPWPF